MRVGGFRGGFLVWASTALRLAPPPTSPAGICDRRTHSPSGIHTAFRATNTTAAALRDRAKPPEDWPGPATPRWPGLAARVWPGLDTVRCGLCGCGQGAAYCKTLRDIAEFLLGSVWHHCRPADAPGRATTGEHVRRRQRGATPGHNNTNKCDGAGVEAPTATPPFADFRKRRYSF